MSRGNRVGLGTKVVDAGKALRNIFFKLFGRFVKTGKAERARAASAGKGKSGDEVLIEKRRADVVVSSVVEEDLGDKVSAEELGAKGAEAMQANREAKARDLAGVASELRSAAAEAEEAVEMLEDGSDIKEEARVGVDQAKLLAEDLDKVAEEVRLGDRASGVKESAVAREKAREVKDIASRARVEAYKEEGEDIEAELREWQEADDAAREARREADAARVAEIEAAKAGDVARAGLPNVEVKEASVVKYPEPKAGGNLMLLRTLDDFNGLREGLEALAKVKSSGGKKIVVAMDLYTQAGGTPEELQELKGMRELLGRLKKQGYELKGLMVLGAENEEREVPL